MAENKPAEKRKYVRTKGSIRAKIKRITPHEFHNIQSLRNTISAAYNAHNSEVTSVVNPLPEPLFENFAEFLLKIDEKLDRLIDILDGNKHDTDKIEVVETIDISGSGISLIISGTIEVGWLVHVTLNIPVCPIGIFNTYGEVVRIKLFQGGSKGLFEIGIKFLDIREKDREILIAYAFSWQRKIIRESKADA